MRKIIFLAGVFLLGLVFLKGLGCSKKQEDSYSSFALIDACLEEEKIDYETALLYKVYALSYDNKLPKKYQSNVLTRGGDSVLREIRRKWDSLSPVIKEKLEPYFKNPLDMESALYLGEQKKVSSVFEFANKAYAEIPDITGLSHFVTDNGKVKIWYKPSQAAVATLVLDAFNNDKIYEKETSLVNRVPLSDNSAIGDDGKFDIFFKNISDEGLCYLGPVVNRKCYGWIILNQNLVGDKMRDALSHEFFHAVQYAIDCMEDDWWQESTATWIQHFVYPAIDTEHEWLTEYFKEYRMAMSVTTKNDKHEYGSYVFPLYIAQKFGATKVGQIWQACEPANVNAEQAVESCLSGGWKESFSEFSKWLYNQAPERYFRDRPGVFLPVEPDMVDIAMSTEETPEMEIAPLGTLIVNYLVDDPSIRSVDFDLNHFHSIYPDIALWAFIKPKNDEMRVEDWSNLSFKNFCFDLPEEDLDYVVLVYGNGSRTVKKDKLFDIDYFVYKYGCWAKLDLNWSVTHHGGGSAQFGKYVPGFSTGSGRYGENGNLSAAFRQVRIDPEDPEDPESGKTLVPYGSFSISIVHNSSGQAGVTGVYVMGGEGKTTGAGSDAWEGNEKSKKGYGLLRLNVIKHDPNQGSTDISQNDINMVSGPMRDMLLQMQAMQGSMPTGFALPKEPGEGEVKYKIFVNIGGIPASFSGKANMSATGVGSSSTSFGETTEIGMAVPISLEDIVAEDTNVIAINKSFNEGGAHIRISGTLKLRRQ